MDIRGLLMTDTGSLSDVVFEVEGGKEIRTHAAILHARVPTLLSAEGGAGTEEESAAGGRVRRIVVRDFSYEAFFDFMMFVYTGSLQFSEKFMVDVWLLAKTHKLNRAMGLCIQAMMKNLDNDNVVFILQSAHRSKIGPIKVPARVCFAVGRWSHVQRQAFCLEYITRHYDSVVASPSIKELDSEVLVELLRLQVRTVERRFVWLRLNHVFDALRRPRVARPCWSRRPRAVCPI